MAFSRKTLSFWGDCFVKRSCFPRASPKSARYHEIVAGTVSGFEANWRRVIIVLYPSSCSEIEHLHPRPPPSKGEGKKGVIISLYLHMVLFLFLLSSVGLLHLSPA